MGRVWLFIAGAFLANGIPHFIHGISGESFHNPFLHRCLPWIPSHIFNVIWGLCFLGLGFFLLSAVGNFSIGVNWNAFSLAIGFVVASVGLSFFFGGGGWREDKRR